MGKKNKNLKDGSRCVNCLSREWKRKSRLAEVEVQGEQLSVPAH